MEKSDFYKTNFYAELTLFICIIFQKYYFLKILEFNERESNLDEENFLKV
ncbi:hypothetical protein LEP1GSC173_2557 [Leptospira interrogans str. HAI1594]|uniref:Uncharacterized protein n=1 Tax=Leptospira interrogans serovar Copenhageni str. LT2050 TaxID=1001598 RepID=M3G604_LEPIT|nr:hypothetical protein LEP1GSC117_4429 [Leptospira interrogans serovar Icterohaemorrhagiae str. Verdun LP]EKP77259.1 hypothetical protein LEP1GSC173_2557 [Leptospira interrogans str. HAI1594]EMG20675.1 hypothetical protein LEP1GSC150_2973 [Leptospira interrogans serovar Copenhageni str. LT2050]EMO17111.1 hypothetical protein LEP1GSC167_1152 [Leptospira interrogans serovar Copenhageni str. HAI0188]EMO37622.1 hypothetical protein LEP1GSC177_1864 [Leptospira interrogans str. MMD3731]EMY55384.1 h